MMKLSSRTLPSLFLLPVLVAACGDSFTTSGAGAGSTTSTGGNGGNGGNTTGGSTTGGSTTGGSTTGGSTTGGSTTGGSTTGGGGGTGGATTGGGGTGGAGPCTMKSDCGPNEDCVMGACVCITGTKDCGDGCIDVQSDVNNCGACGTTCSNKCVAGACNDPVDIAAGGNTTCAVLALGDVYCWGRNGSGQFGSGAGANAASPVQVGVNLPPMKRVFIGKNTDNGHVCAISQANELYCWGSNQAGKLGLGIMDTGVQPWGKLMGIADIPSVGLGAFHSVATAGQKVLGWGANDVEQLGYVGPGTLSPNSQSQQNAEQVAAGGAHTCAVLGGSLTCWGRSLEGQLGIGQAVLPQGPQLVFLDGQSALEVACGEAHTCVRLDGGGDVLCWGLNGEGQLGNGGNAGTNTPGEPVNFNGTSAIAIFAGMGHTGAISSNNDLYLWGRNTQGQVLSAGGSPASVSTPTKVGNLHNVRKAALGTQHTCVLDKNAGLAHVLCWGGNVDGQLGNGSIGGDHQAATKVVFP